VIYNKISTISSKRVTIDLSLQEADRLMNMCKIMKSYIGKEEILHDYKCDMESIEESLRTMIAAEDGSQISINEDRDIEDMCREELGMAEVTQ
jgi:hypothetical protein